MQVESSALRHGPKSPSWPPRNCLAWSPSLWQGLLRVTTSALSKTNFLRLQGCGPGLSTGAVDDRSDTCHIHARSSTLLFSSVKGGKETGSPSHHLKMNYLIHIWLWNKWETHFLICLAIKLKGCFLQKQPGLTKILPLHFSVMPVSFHPRTFTHTGHPSSRSTWLTLLVLKMSAQACLSQRTLPGSSRAHQDPFCIFSSKPKPILGPEAKGKISSTDPVFS